MPLFNEKEILNADQHEQLDLTALEIGQSIGFYFDNIKDQNSEEYGPFIICRGLKFDFNASSVDSLIASSNAASFIPNTLLKNKIEDGSLSEGELYRIEKAWDKKQKFSGGKKAKGWGYKLFHLEVNPKIKREIKDAYLATLSPVNATETESIDTNSEEQSEYIPPKRPQV